VNVQTRVDAPRDGAVRQAIADCDIHPALPKGGGLAPYLERKWLQHLAAFGPGSRTGFLSGPPYPKGQPDASRRDSYPPDGGRPGSSLDFMRAQHLDPNGVALGLLNPIAPHPGACPNPDLAIALARAVNDWQIAEWIDPEPRLRASVTVAYEDGPAAAEEIRRRAGDRRFAQVILLSRAAAPLGQKRYWPIYQAAEEAGLPVAIHAFGYGGNPITSAGWPSYYIEEMVGHAQSCQGLLASLVFEGVFARFPRLRIVLVEAGFAWLPALTWRMDRAWARLRQEVPHLTRPPSDYVREQVWLTTQPMEEPPRGQDLLDCMAQIGWDRLLFATDYPHWDYDDPSEALPLRMDAGPRGLVLLDNAKALYGIA
jgi:predicted TIM-barrel fold metal-dependent hydrolase